MLHVTILVQISNLGSALAPFELTSERFGCDSTTNKTAVEVVMLQWCGCNAILRLHLTQTFSILGSVMLCPILGCSKCLPNLDTASMPSNHEAKHVFF